MCHRHELSCHNNLDSGIAEAKLFWLVSSKWTNVQEETVDTFSFKNIEESHFKKLDLVKWKGKIKAAENIPPVKRRGRSE